MTELSESGAAKASRQQQMEATEVREWEGLPSNTREKVQEETCYIIIIIIFLNHPQGFVPCGTTHTGRERKQQRRAATNTGASKWETPAVTIAIHLDSRAPTWPPL